MPLIIGVISQKGGVGKSTIARMIACQYALNEWNVKIADMDLAQGTSTNWNRRRMQNTLNPMVAVEQFMSVADAIKATKQHDLLIFDGAPHSTRMTLDIAKASDIVLLPSGVSLDDLEPTIRLAHELKQNKIDKDKICIALSRVGSSESEVNEAKDYIAQTGYFLLEGLLQEKTAIRRAQDEGRSATETLYKSVNDKVDVLMQSVVNRIEQLQNGNSE
jgi:chromosome partitioning protein